MQPPTQEVLRRLMGSFNPQETFRALSKLPRPAATFVAQLRSGHCPLNGYLHRFKAADPPNCDLCQQTETTDHYLLTCRKYTGLRRELFDQARKAAVPTNRTGLLTCPKAYQPLADFGRKTFRFYRARYKPSHRPALPHRTNGRPQ